ncbi:ABC transporter permease subunit [Clostridium thermarum]|uniref:ABC transporter permease subunit n=1 Tax=Clostridium thermarum TaxID=1716543 RepID=UPI00111CEDB9|nr:ABC transporter permease subunit [Clostridium thermarum]
MYNLMLTEIRKFFCKRKNILTILGLCALLLIYVFANNSLDNLKTESKLSSYKEELKSSQDSLTTLKQTYDSSKSDMKKLGMLIQRLEENIELMNERNSSALRGDWKTEIKNQIELDKNLLSDINLGNAISGEDTASIEKRIKKNQLLLDSNIEPVNEEASMTAYNFIRLAFRDVLPIVLIIFVLLLSSDVVSSESDEGTFKVLLTQPISRAKILFSKIIAISCIITIITFAILGLFFLALGFTKGSGNPNYPTEFANINFKSLFYGNNGSILQGFIGIGQFILLILPMQVLLVIFISSIGVLVSTIVQNSTVSISVAVIGAVSINILNNQLHFFKKVSHLIPLTYCNIVELLNGNLITKFNNNVTYFNGVLIICSFAIVSIAA